VFAVSTFGKVRAQPAFVRSFSDFGVPERARVMVGALVTVAEVAVVVLAVVVGFDDLLEIAAPAGVGVR